MAEQLSRLAGLEVDVEVRPLPGDEDGLRWRSRVEFAVDPGGRPGLRPFHTRDVLPIDDCLIAARSLIDTGVLSRSWPGQRAVDAVAPSVGEAVLVPVPEPKRRGAGEVEAPEVVERVEVPGWCGELAVDARGFWQVHPGAAGAFLGHVLERLVPRPGERALDLYAGVGLFARALADAVGADGRVWAVEAEGRAVQLGQRDTASLAQLSWRVGRVERELTALAEAGELSAGGSTSDRGVDLVVLDPPRAGAGAQVAGQVAALGPRAIAYVACDPAALARDLRTLTDAGYALDSLAAFDAFPMTHHVECIAILRPGSAIQG